MPGLRGWRDGNPGRPRCAAVITSTPALGSHDASVRFLSVLEYQRPARAWAHGECIHSGLHVRVPWRKRRVAPSRTNVSRRAPASGAGEVTRALTKPK
jgi:hypothetical protein